MVDLFRKIWGMSGGVGRWVLLLGLGIVPVGCVTPGAVDIPAPSQTPVVGQSVSAEAIMPLRPVKAKVERVVDGGEARTIGYRLGPYEGGWRSGLEGVRRVEMKKNDDGAVVIVAEEDLSESVRVEYSPGLVMLPAKLTAGEPFEGRSKVTVRNLSDGTVTQTGKVTYRVELVEAGADDVCGRGEPDREQVYVVESHRRLDLSLAQALVSTRECYAAGRGWLGETVTCVTRPLGLFETKQVQVLRVTHWER